MIERLSRIVLICRDLERLAAFYIQAFGFICVHPPRSDPLLARLWGRPSGEVSVCTLRLGSQVLVLAEPRPAGRDYPSELAGWDLRFQHFAIVVADMAAAYAALQAVAGWTPISRGGPQTLPASSGGVTAFKFRDPQGHPLELLAFPPERAPSVWARSSGTTCMGIDHSAISVTDSNRSVAYYRRLGLSRSGGSLNQGAPQQRLDDVDNAVVEVTALAPRDPPPHLELLCYRGQFDRRGPVPAPTDSAATHLVFSLPRGALDALIADPPDRIVCALVQSEHDGISMLLRDPDGHFIWLEGS